MTKKKISSRNHDTGMLAKEIEWILAPGEFVSYSEAWSFIQELEDMMGKLHEFVDNGEAEKAVPLYEIFLAGCYDKADEVDDSSGDLGMFFGELFASWIEARQKAKCDAGETVNQILQWMANDDYGYCYNIENILVKALNRQGLKVFEGRIKQRFDKAYDEKNTKIPLRIDDFSFPVRENAGILKCIYIEKKDITSYMNLCEKVGFTPQDCESIGELHKAKKRFREALEWIDKALELEKDADWRNYAGLNLNAKKRELLSKLGQKTDAFTSAWSDYKDHPSSLAYDEFLKYVPDGKREYYHNQALEIAKNTSLSAIIDLAVQTKEWDVLAECILSAGDEELESFSHYTTGDVAKGLKKKHLPAAAKVYRAMAMRIVKAGKSKYYSIAVNHLKKVRELYKKTGGEEEWLSLVETIQKDHYRKSSFMPKFRKLLAGQSPKTFDEKTRERWKKQTS